MARTPENYMKQVRRFLKSADWLGETEAPMIMHLKVLAMSLDKQVEETGAVQSSLSNTFSIVWSKLMDTKPKAQPEAEEADADLGEMP